MMTLDIEVGESSYALFHYICGYISVGRICGQISLWVDIAMGSSPASVYLGYWGLLGYHIFDRAVVDS